MIFFLIMLCVLYVGRKLGWSLSKNVLYSAPIVVVFSLCLLWGAGLAFGIHSLIRWLSPNIVLRILMGFGVGAYVSKPNYGLVAESTIHGDAMPRHVLISNLPLVAFIAASIAFAFLP